MYVPVNASWNMDVLDRHCCKEINPDLLVWKSWPFPISIKHTNISIHSFFCNVLWLELFYWLTGHPLVQIVYCGPNCVVYGLGTMTTGGLSNYPRIYSRLAVVIFDWISHFIPLISTTPNHPRGWKMKVLSQSHCWMYWRDKSAALTTIVHLFLPISPIQLDSDGQCQGRVKVVLLDVTASYIPSAQLWKINMQRTRSWRLCSMCCSWRSLN